MQLGLGLGLGTGNGHFSAFLFLVIKCDFVLPSWPGFKGSKISYVTDPEGMHVNKLQHRKHEI